MRRSKKFLSLILALAMTLAIVPMAAFATGEEEYTLTEVSARYDEMYPSTPEGPWEVRKGDKWGYVDGSGREIIPCKYDFAGSFSDGRASVANGTKWGMVDDTGKEVVPCKYDNTIPTFRDGLAPVCLDKKWGYIDEGGKEVIPIQYDSASSFSDGLAWVTTAESEVCIDTAGNTVFQYEANSYRTLSPFSGGLAVIHEKAHLGIFQSDDGSYYMSNVPSTYTLIDKTGEPVTDVQYDSAGSLGNGMAIVRQGDRRSVIDSTGKEIKAGEQYETIEKFSESYLRVKKDGKYGLVNYNWEEVVPCKYDWIPSAFSETLFTVMSDKKVGLVDLTGKEFVPCKYDNTSFAASHISDGMLIVCQNGKYGAIDMTTGKETVPTQCDWIYPFQEGVAAVRIDEKYGYIDKTGREIVPCKYDWVSDFGSGLALVATIRGDQGWTPQYYLIDKTGKEVFTVPDGYGYENYILSELRPRFVGDWLVMYSGRHKLALMNKKGKFVEAEYPDVSFADAEGYAGLVKENLLLIRNGVGVFFVEVSKGHTTNTASPSTQIVNVDGKPVEFAMYALNGGSTNYIRVRDLAAVLSGTSAQFNVDWNGNVTLTSKTRYDGPTDKAPFTTPMAYTDYTTPTYVDGKAVDLEAIQIEYNGGGFTYYKLRDLAQALNFNVGWSAEKGIFVETDKPYDPNN